ncbi:MAG: C25 family cysteine peptidase [Anaerolineales bacterium]|nr:C25 family cysteine peptidase [Anaerolineales bacterium]
MLQRFVSIIVALSILIPWSPAPAQEEERGLVLLQSGQQGVEFRLYTPEYEISDVVIDGEIYQQLGVEGYALSSQPARPQLPVFSVLLGVPPDAAPVLDFDVVREAAFSTIRDLAPAPSPVSLAGDLTPGLMGYQTAPDDGRAAALYPAAPARLAEEVWVRDHRLVRVEISPFQYDPATRQVGWRQEIAVRVDFVQGPDSAGGEEACLGICGQPSPFDAVLKGQVLNYEQARHWRGMPAGQGLKSSTNLFGPTPGQTSYKIAVDADGLYRVTYADLLNAGLTVSDSCNLQLYNQGRPVAIHIPDELPCGPFSPGDSLYFYGEAFSGDYLAGLYSSEMSDWLWMCTINCDLAGMFEKYTAENIYWLAVESSPGLRMASVDGQPAGEPVPPYYTDLARAEEEHAWFSFHFTSEDTWFWEHIQPGPASATRTYTTTLTALATGPLTATVRAEVVSRAQNINHHTQFYLNGGAQPIDDSTWFGRTNHKIDVPVAQSVLGSGAIELDFVSVYSGAIDDLYFNWFEIEYARQFVARGDELLFSHGQAGAWNYQVSEFQSPAVQVFDITNPLQPVRILNPISSLDGGSSTISFSASPSPEGRFLMAGSAGERSPLSITAYTPVDFSAVEGADYLIITHPDMEAAAQILADFRANQGLDSLIVSIEEVINQFNFGIYHSIAMRNFIKFALENWTLPPSYVLLAGGGHWNLKGVPDYGSSQIYVPPNLAFVDPWQGEVDSANLLAAVIGDDILPDVAIGRMPANSPAELAIMISKTIDYENAAYQDWAGQVLFVADNTPDPAGDFVELSEDLIAGFVDPSPYLEPERIYKDDFPNPAWPNINNAITNTINITSSVLVNYIGHASIDFWAENIFNNQNVATLTNSGRLPVFLSMTCLDGYWIYPDRPSLVHELLRSDNSGSVASFAPTGLGVATGHDRLNQGVFESLLEAGDWELGAAVQAGKLNLFTDGSNFDLIHTFSIFGDPALQILNPYDVAVSPQNPGGTGSPGVSVQHVLQVTNTGGTGDTYDVSISGNQWPTQVSQAVIANLLPGQTAQLTVTVDIPQPASGGDTAVIAIVSQGDTHKMAQANVATLIASNQIFLPSVHR